MQRIRHLIKQQHIAFVLLLGITLRSLIAAGFMLDTQADDALFSVTLCDGPAGINAIPQDDTHAHHHIDHEQHNSATAEHDMSACHIWSASAQAISFYSQQSLQPDLFKYLDYNIENRPLFFAPYQFNAQPRAPPEIA